MQDVEGTPNADSCFIELLQELCNTVRYHAVTPCQNWATSNVLISLQVSSLFSSVSQYVSLLAMVPLNNLCSRIGPYSYIRAWASVSSGPSLYRTSFISSSKNAAIPWWLALSLVGSNAPNVHLHCLYVIESHLLQLQTTDTQEINKLRAVLLSCNLILKGSI